MVAKMSSSSSFSRGCRQRRNERRVLQVRTVDFDQAAHPHQRQRAGDLVDVVAVELEVGDQDLEHRSGHGLVDLHPHHVGETPLPDAFFDRLQQVAGFQVLNGRIGVAGHVEGMRLDDLHAGKQRSQVGRDQLFDPDEHLFLHHDFGPALRLRSHRHRHQLRQRVGNLHARKVLDALGIAQDHGQIQAEVRDVRERPAGIEGQRSQRGENRVLKIGVGDGTLLFGQVSEIGDAHSGFAQAWEPVPWTSIHTPRGSAA